MCTASGIVRLLESFTLTRRLGRSVSGDAVTPTSACSAREGVRDELNLRRHRQCRIDSHVLTAGELGDGLELSPELLEEVLGGVGHGNASGAGAQTRPQGGVVAGGLHEAKGASVLTREVAGTPAQIAGTEGRVENDTAARAQDDVGATEQLVEGPSGERG